MKIIIFCIPMLISCQHLKRPTYNEDYFKQTWDKAHQEVLHQNFESAESLYKEVYSLGIESAPQYSTRSLFELAQINESKGNWEIALSQFKECESKKSHMPRVQSELELPARLAGAYAALGEIELSDVYSQLAEQALQTYSAQLRPDLRPDWWAETYFRMGSMPIQGMTDQNWLAYAKRFESSVTHLIRSMEYADSNWSQKSLLQAENFFKKSLEFSDVSQDMGDENWWVKKDLIRQKLDTMSFIIKKIRLWRLNKEQPSKWITQFYNTIDMIDIEIRQRRAQFQDTTPLTPDNLKRKNIKREDLEVVP